MVYGIKHKTKDQKVKNFSDLVAWQVGHELVLEIYKMTKAMPKEEMFGLISQMRRATVSITSNIAEGFSRRTAADKKQFYTMALGSLTELQNQLLLSRDLKYIADEVHLSCESLAIRVHKLLCGLIKSAETRKS